MADYWVSQARKFCDFCKCWIADNKPSVQSHENGKRHKEAVAQRISQMTKQSVKDMKESLKIDEEMKKMEEAAMKAYLKDVESNPDYTSQVIKETISEARKMKETETDKKPEIPIAPPPEKSAKKKASAASKNVQESIVEEDKKWYEAQSDEGYTYYWNYITGESRWEAPPEGYVSIEEQTKASSEATSSGTNETTSEIEKKDEPIKKEPKEKPPKPSKRKIEVKVEEKDEAPPDIGVGPSCKPDPYGGWKTVETRVQEPIDYQLPQQEFIEIKVPTITEPEIKFKEKKVTSIDDSAGSTTFKKRKFGARGNARQRLDDD
ncbi:WW domain-binding protein 4 isoform X1 [Nilaparvata lugens]|uniref:WW domain-binding protein 4 isoform X1 n=1 Tax=Nilaparvata lugens TaxID=108931 RepID=UPI00193D6869|nr:WW domain-binding protein 4 isoform X1 [Nilaparvata lugens]